MAATLITIANLGDAALTILTSTVTGTTSIVQSGLLFSNNTSAAAITLTLASGLTPFVVVKDVAGNAGTYPITVAFSAGIDGNASYVITQNYGWVWLAWNATNTNYNLIG
jgi:hypothetical protein